MKRIISVLIIPIFAVSALAQVQHGTVGVVYFSQDKIIVAADSRNLFNRAGIPPNDSACKIAALNNQIIFMAANDVGYGSINLLSGWDPVEPWKAGDDIRKVYAENILSAKRAWIGMIADKWGSLECKRFGSLYAFHPDEVSKGSLGTNGLLVVAFIGGIDVPGYMILFRVVVTFDKGRKPPIDYRVEPVTCQTDLGPYCAMGEFEIFNLYTNFMQRGPIDPKLFSLFPMIFQDRVTFANGKAFSTKYGPEDLDIIKTVRLVDMEIAFHKGNGIGALSREISDVGGKIDAVQLTGSGTLRWFARKDNCPAD
jgi:hypothetical protein